MNAPPRPLALLSDESLRDVPVVATDCDDTLTAHGALHTGALAALHTLARAGVPCVVATGRPVGWAEVLARLLPVRAVVAENGGAYVLRDGTVLREGFVDDARAREEGMARVHACVRSLTERFPELALVRDRTLRATDVALDVGESRVIAKDTVREAEAFVRARGLFAVASTVHLHVSFRAPDKFSGLVAVGAALGLCDDERALRRRWLYVGDSPNDAGAFAAIERSVGVKSVLSFAGSIDAWPAFVTEGGPGEGFVEVALRLLAARGAPTTLAL